MISVCMATKNGELFIREQIDSILTQLNNTDELIVSDDCSEDRTVSIIESYADKRIILLKNSKEKGVAGNFERSLTQSSGDYIFLADQDDVWMPHKIRVMTSHLEEYDLVISDCSIADHSLQPKYHSFFDLNRSGKGFLKNLFKNSYMGCCMAFRKQVLKRALPFPKDLSMHDLWIGLIGELHFSVYFIPQSLMKHRRHEHNSSTTSGDSENPLHFKVYDRYKIIKNLLFHKTYAG
jgi:glycosyltransferase involved in cell wall biosynthesis